jgi:hypothetical protein
MICGRDAGINVAAAIVLCAGRRKNTPSQPTEHPAAPDYQESGLVTHA